MDTETTIDLKEKIIDTCWSFGNLLMDRDEIYADFESVFEIVKQGPYVFANYFDEDEWDDEISSCYHELLQLTDTLYEVGKMAGQDEEQIDQFIQKAIWDYVVWF